MEKVSMYKQAWLAGALRAMSRAGFKAPGAGSLAAYGKPMNMFTVPAVGAGIGGVATPLLHEDTFYDRLTGNTGPSLGSYLKNMAIGAGAGFGVQGLSKLAPVRRWAFDASRNPAMAKTQAARAIAREAGRKALVATRQDPVSGVAHAISGAFPDKTLINLGNTNAPNITSSISKLKSDWRAAPKPPKPAEFNPEYEYYGGGM